ncbi:MAG: DivIVA domain-containing protein [Bifidobacteriaceae bacterium]|jgi:DivIVA domain-containing protein|nr:DivIVA domain-containing protein [Bifidobacteriaceae bacterium]
MAQLTADDVVLKSFQVTKFREGYDQVEVDDFLDEVAVSMRAMAAENDDLKAKLAEAERRVAELEAGGGAPAPGGQALPALPLPPAPAGPAAPAAPPAPTVPEPAPEEESAIGMLGLARKLHDQYVMKGQEEGDQILSDAKAKAAALVREAEETSARTTANLEQERADLEREIEGLRIFERDYRTRLRTYLGNLLRDIDGPAADKSQGDALGGN